jgi:hypothetical protein
LIFPSEIRGQRNAAQSAKGVKPKMRDCKLRSGVNCRGALKGKKRKTRAGCTQSCETHVSGRLQLLHSDR